MIIKMKETRRGTEDGHIVQRFEEDTIYNVRDGLGRAFLASGYAETYNSTCNSVNLVNETIKGVN